MKYFQHFLGILCAFCLMIIFLITSVEAVAYWTPGYYEKEYENIGRVVHEMPKDNFPYFNTLIRFQYALLNK